MNERSLISYQQLLDALEHDGQNHLLLGNGFNNSLGIETNYLEIFSRMKKEYSGYAILEDSLKDKGYDIEKLIVDLKQQVKDDDGFLKGFIERKVKLDFMEATNDIVQESIKNVYQEKNQDVHLLLRNFTSYFTLNYDPFLYLLLLKFKEDESYNGNALAMQNTSLFQAADLDKNQNKIYQEIQNARKSGNLEINIGKSSSKMNLNSITKTHFEAIIIEYCKRKNKGWRTEDIRRTCDQIWKEEKNQLSLTVNDGFQQELFKEGELQNLYFLHGAFHIIKNGNYVQKITAQQNKTFCQKLAEAINSKNKDIVCVFTGSSQEKRDSIKNNSYLTRCFNDLSKIDGSLVILGSSFGKNDQHIFEQIKKSDAHTVYVSSCIESKEYDFKRATILGPKEIVLFDYKTISYERG